MLIRNGLLSASVFAKAFQHVACLTYGNQVQAAALQNAAITLPSGSYTLKNAGTGETLSYNPNGNHIFPSDTSSTSIGLQNHGTADWTRLSFGVKNKCLSSSWASGADRSAVAYACVVGSNPTGTASLEPTKQWWIIVPVTAGLSNPTPQRTKYLNNILITSQLHSVSVRNKAIANGTDRMHSGSASTATFKKTHSNRKRRDLTVKMMVSGGFLREKRGKLSGRKQKVKHISSRKTRKTRAASNRLYYIIAADHLIDQPARALTSGVVVSRGIKSTQLSIFQEGTKNQMWSIV